MPKLISIGDLVVQRDVPNARTGIVLVIKYGRSEIPKNEPDLYYEYAVVQWLGGPSSTIKTSLLKKIS